MSNETIKINKIIVNKDVLIPGIFKTRDSGYKKITFCIPLLLVETKTKIVFKNIKISPTMIVGLRIERKVMTKFKKHKIRKVYL